MSLINMESFDGCFIFLFILMAYLLYQERKYNHHITKLFVYLLLTDLVLFAFDLLSRHLGLIPGAYQWCTLSSSIKYVLKPLLLYEILLITVRESTARKKLLLALPLLLLTLVLAISFPFKLVFYHTPETNHWNEGPLLPITWIVLLFYMVMIMVSAIRLHGFHEESQLLLLGESFILLNIFNERFIPLFPNMEQTVIMVAILSYYLYHRTQAEAEYRVKKEKEVDQARIQAMISQIKPHFIYNSLACIAETCHQNAAQGEEAILTFSGYLRSCFESLTDDGMIPFSEELKTIENYLALETLQAPEKLSVIYDIRERCFQVPILAVETLVENAVKHGIRKKHGHGSVTLKTERDERGIVISILDDGIGFDTEKQLPDEKHLGLKNARIRFADQCGASMTVVSQPSVGTQITIIIPKE